MKSENRNQNALLYKCRSIMWKLTDCPITEPAEQQDVWNAAPRIPVQADQTAA